MPKPGDHTAVARFDASVLRERYLEALARFERPRMRWVAIVLALALCAPALATGLVLDDYKLLVQLEHPNASPWPGSAPLDLFRWMDPAHNRALMERGGFPWWTNPDARLGFMRPLTSFSHWLDHALLHDRPWLMHAHSLAWFALILLLATRLYSAFENRFVGGLAAGMFALDDSHGMTVSWLCNRSALIAGAFCIAALGLHHRARAPNRGRSWPWLLLAVTCFACALAAGEAAVALLGYLVAYAVFLDQGRARDRAFALAPYAVLLLAYGALRARFGYGATGLGSYLDPVNEPSTLAAVLPARLGQIGLSQLVGLCADLWGLRWPGVRACLLVLGVPLVLAMLWYLAPSLRARASSRFWAAGALLAALPATAMAPSDRLLLMVGLGVMPLIAQAMADALALPPSSRRATQRYLYTGAVAAFTLFASPGLLALQTLGPTLAARGADAADAELPSDAALREQTVIVTQVPDSSTLSFVPVMRALRDAPSPRSLYWLAAGSAPVQFQRLDARRVRVSADAGLFDWDAEQYSRSKQLPFRAGDRVELAQMEVSVLAVTPDGRPTLCEVRFKQPLESPGYRWLAFHNGRFEPLRLPHFEQVSLK